jgi:hypothetical protein
MDKRQEMFNYLVNMRNSAGDIRRLMRIDAAEFHRLFSHYELWLRESATNASRVITQNREALKDLWNTIQDKIDLWQTIRNIKMRLMLEKDLDQLMQTYSSALLYEESTNWKRNDENETTIGSLSSKNAGDHNYDSVRNP